MQQQAAHSGRNRAVRRFRERARRFDAHGATDRVHTKPSSGTVKARNRRRGRVARQARKVNR